MAKTKNVLSVDMDYIMSPCINLYNDCAGSEEFREGDFWTRVNLLRSIDKYLEYDPAKLVYITDVLTKAIKNTNENNIMFAREHDMILELLCGTPTDELYNIYNVDHHHDLYYCPEQKNEVDRFDFACLADWVYYLGKNEKINKYYWVRNENSDLFDERERGELTFPYDDEKMFKNPECLKDIHFDYVFCCRSKEYFPDKFEYLFEMLRKAAENIKGKEIEVWEKPYCIDGKSRPVAKER